MFYGLGFYVLWFRVRLLGSKALGYRDELYSASGSTSGCDNGDSNRKRN